MSDSGNSSNADYDEPAGETGAFDDVPSVNAVIKQEEELRMANDARLAAMIATYGRAPDPGTWNSQRLAALCDLLWGAEGTPSRAKYELELQQKFTVIIDQAERELREQAIMASVPFSRNAFDPTYGMKLNGKGIILP